MAVALKAGLTNAFPRAKTSPPVKSACASFWWLALSTAMLPAATLTVEFKPAPGVQPDYEVVNVWVLDDRKGGGWDDSLKWSTADKSFKKAFVLEPSDRDYFVTVFTGRFEEKNLARAGAYYCGTQAVSLTNATDRETISLEYRPLTNFTFFKGESTRAGKVVDAEGRPVADFEVRLFAYFQEQEGKPFTIASTRTKADGAFLFSGLSTTQSFSVRDAAGSYLVRCQRDEPALLRLRPSVGTLAPDFPLVDLGTGQTNRLSEWRGKIEPPPSPGQRSSDGRRVQKGNSFQLIRPGHAP
jgi:hypothetical protein